MLGQKHVGRRVGVRRSSVDAAVFELNFKRVTDPKIPVGIRVRVADFGIQQWRNVCCHHLSRSTNLVKGSR